MSKTYLVRTEPRTTSADLEAGIAARISDPLWLLGRQWQLGELLGEDAGSPVSIDMSAETAMVSRFLRPGQTSGVPYDPALVPLDALTADAIRSEKRWTARLRVDTGRAFLRALADAGVESQGTAFREAFPIEEASAEIRRTEPAGARLLDVAVGRIPDGQQLYASLAGAVRSGADLPEPPAIPAQDLKAVYGAAEAWLGWCDETLAETGPSTWVPEQLAHEFGVATGTGAGATVLDAKDFRGESLDWHSFDVRPNPQPSGFKALPPMRPLPTGVRFRGMPNARWWELEDASVDLGNVDAGPSDIARLALLEFALVYGNDFFAIPLRLPVGSLTRIASLVVGDTFGMRLRIRSAADSVPGAERWSMFTLSERDAGTPGGGVSDLLFLPPVSNQVITGEPIEEVMFLRDEMANLAWAVERRYEGETGSAVERIEEMTRTLPELAAPDAESPLRYILGTTVPPYWFPLVPQALAGGGLGLQLEQMAYRDVSEIPRGRFLDLGGPPVADAEVPREGTRLTGDYLLTRWTNGDPLLWARRVRRVGRGEGSSGIRFEAAEVERAEIPD
jgi:hypothetical protein